MKRSHQWAALIISALSLLHGTSGGTVRRKRRYVVVQDDGDHESRSSRERYFYRRGNLVEMPSILAEERKLKAKAKAKGGRRSRAGDYKAQNARETNADTNDDGGTFQYHGPTTAENVDWSQMTSEEIEYFFQIEHAQSYPDTDVPEARPTPKPAPSPTLTPEPSPTSSVPSPTKQASTSPPTAAPTPEQTTKATPNPTAKATPNPTVKVTPAPTKRPLTPQPTAQSTDSTPEPTAEDENPQPPAPPSIAPSLECEDMDRNEALLMVIGQITEQSVLMDTGTPQSQAYTWMLDEDPAQVDPCTYETTLQRYALVTHYYATEGGSWENSNGWLGQDGECIWLGINCNGSGDATRIELRENNLAGSLAPELSALSSLRRVDVSGNSITGELVELSSSLSFLDVERNEMSGTLKPLLVLSGVRQLHMSSNGFSGDIPTEIGELTGLEELWLANNQFGGATLPSEIGSLENLETLFVYNAQMGGSLPSELGNLGLSELLANNNKFESTIPETLWNNDGLTLLRLDSNELTGSISTRVGDLTDLTDLFLNNNALTSSLPVQMQRLTSLVNLLINDNVLTGTIRDGFDSFRSLDFCDFSANMFSGTLPSTLFDIRDLRFLYLSNNALEGALPENWGNAVLLRDLFVDNNELTGSVPEIPTGAFARLTELLLNGNKFTGEMPGSICQLRSSAILEDLWADCAGNPPEIQCALPSCCTFCFE